MSLNLLDIFYTLAKMAFVFGFCLMALPPIIWFERRGSAWIQGRVGPNRVGPFGLLQPLADVIKFFFKEDFTPKKANKFYYYLAPALTLVAPFAALMMIPFGSSLIINGQEIPLQIASFDAGILLVLAFTGLEVYPVILAGWSSNNKYSTMGALRGASQMVSYEISMGLSLLSMLIVYGTFDMNKMVLFQEQYTWGAFLNPIAALIFWVSIFAETNRLPFDLPEGDSEIIAGYHLEYGAMKFALFFMGEYVAMMMASALMATIFMGGYGLLPGLSFFLHGASHNTIALLQVLSFILKIGFLMFVFIWVRWTLPRFRFDQLMNLGWKILLPLALVNLVLMTILAYFLN